VYVAIISTLKKPAAATKVANGPGGTPACS
jgi:hypothetical protein